MKFKSDLTVFGNLHKRDVSKTRLKAREFLAEPAPISTLFMPSVGRHLLGATARPIAVGVEGADRDRLEAAKWFIAAEDADLEAARDACWPAWRAVNRLALGVGSLAPSVVLVGMADGASDTIPFVGKAFRRIFRGLRLLGYDELEVYCLNAIDSKGRKRRKVLADLRSAFSQYEPVWVAVGREAGRALKREGVDHGVILGPGYHVINLADEGLPGYAKRLVEAGVVARDKPFDPKPIVAELPKLPQPYHRTDVKSSQPRRRLANSAANGLSTANREKARRLFVTTNSNYTQVGKELGLDPKAVASASHEGAWKSERESYQRDLTEKAKMKSMEAEATASANSRRLAWASTELALVSVTRRLKDGTLIPEIKDAKTLAATAIALSERVIEADKVGSELAGKTLKELMVEVNETILKNFSGGTHR